MRTAERVTTETVCCLSRDSLAHAARPLRHRNCGGRGTGKRIDEMNTGGSLANDALRIKPDDSSPFAEMLTGVRDVHRPPVVDANRRLFDMLCCDDLMRWDDDGGSSDARPTDPMSGLYTPTSIGRPRSSAPDTSAGREAEPQGTPGPNVVHDAGSSGIEAA